VGGEQLGGERCRALSRRKDTAGERIPSFGAKFV